MKKDILEILVNLKDGEIVKPRYFPGYYIKNNNEEYYFGCDDIIFMQAPARSDFVTLLVDYIVSAFEQYEEIEHSYYLKDNTGQYCNVEDFAYLVDCEKEDARPNSRATAISFMSCNVNLEMKEVQDGKK